MLNFGPHRSLGGKNLNFFVSLGFAEASQIFKLLIHPQVALLKTFSEQFEVCFYFNYLRSYEVSKLGDNSFETDFRSMAEVLYCRK